MPITPVEIHHLQIGRRLLGYRRSTVDHYLDEIAASFEVVWRERADLTDRVEHLETELQRHRELEGLLRSTLVSAERAAQEQLETARREGKAIVVEAHVEARSVTHEAEAARERLETDIRRVESILRSALAVVGDRHAGERQGKAPAAASDSEVRRLAG